MKLTETQFGALATLLRVRAGKSREAARMVLVEGVTATGAAARAGLSLAGVSNAVAVFRRGYALAKAVTEVQRTED